MRCAHGKLCCFSRPRCALVRIHAIPITYDTVTADINTMTEATSEWIAMLATNAATNATANAAPFH